MSRITIPKLISEFSEFGACFTLDNASAELSKWIAENRVEEAVVRSPADSTQWIELSLNLIDDNVGHLHIDFYNDGQDRTATKDLSAFAELVTEFMSHSSNRQVQVQSRLEFDVSLADIPTNGSVDRLLRFHHRSCGATVALTGASLEFQDDDWFDRMRFIQTISDRLCGVLWGSSLLSFDDHVLAQVYELMSVGVDCFVFERMTREEVNA